MLVSALEQVKTSETCCEHNCAEAVSLAVKKAGLDNSSFTISCTQTRSKLRANPDWIEVTGQKYQRNDIILFDWDGSGDCDHIGIIREASGDVISYDDFNSSQNPRGYYKGHGMNVNNSSIATVFRYRNISVSSSTKYTERFIELGKGDGGAIVKLIQAIVQTEADGMFGRNTEEAVKSFQKRMDCGVDGIVGKETFTAMAEYVKKLVNK